MALTVPLPKAGERFSDEELHTKYGVPRDGGIRVNQENKCIVLENLINDRTKYTNTDRGTYILYMGQNSDRSGIKNQEMSDNNLALKNSKREGYTVLYFTREDGMLVFKSRVEYDSHDWKVGRSATGQRRVVIVFNLLVANDGASALRQPASGTKGTGEGTETAPRAAAKQTEIEAIDSPPLTPEEIAAVEDCLSDPDQRIMSNEEFLEIVTDSNKLKEHIRRMDSNSQQDRGRDHNGS